MVIFVKKMDYIFAVVVIITALTIWGYSLKNAKSGSCVEIYSDQQCIGTYELNTNQEIPVYYLDSEYNIVLIHEGKVSVKEANCPDLLCVRQKPIYRQGESIICLPHKLYIVIPGSNSSEIDAIAN